MNRDYEITLGTTLVQRVGSIPMTHHERQAALRALHTATLLVDRLAWMADKLQQLRRLAFLRPSAQH